MAVSGVAFFVFLLPVVGSLLLGSLVLGEVLKEPDRELNLIPVQNSVELEIVQDSLKIVDIQKDYSLKTIIEFHIMVNDTIFDCGDLYVSIYDTNSKQLIEHIEYYGQCFLKNNSLLPVDDLLDIKIDSAGIYEIEIIMVDKHKDEKSTLNERFIVK